MIGWLSKMLRRKAPAPEPESLSHFTLRRWESADTDRLNEAHWKNVTGQTINEDLYGRLATLRARAAFEVASNPIVEGVITTHAADVVGPHGPTLQVQSSSPEYNRALEKVWRLWFRRPTIDGKLTGPALLRLWIRGYWINGEILAQKVSSRSPGESVSLRLKTIHPSRLDTPPDQAGNADVALGVERNREGQPLRYWISDPKQFGAFSISLANYTPIPAADVIHRFAALEEDQVRGAPWLATSLNVIGELRDYDKSVLQAARFAASVTGLLTTNHDDAEYIAINESVEMEPGSVMTAPPHYDLTQMTAQQPSAQYIDFRQERLAEIGRPVSMPLMIVRLTAQKHNYSSARMDDANYNRGLCTTQSDLADTLDELVEDVSREAELAGALPPKPDEVRYEWIWPVRPHVDPVKEAAAEAIAIDETGVLPWMDAVVARGGDPEVVAEKIRVGNILRAKAGLPPQGSKAAGGVQRDPDEDDEDDPDAADKKELADAEA